VIKAFTLPNEILNLIAPWGKKPIRLRRRRDARKKGRKEEKESTEGTKLFSWGKRVKNKPGTRAGNGGKRGEKKKKQKSGPRVKAIEPDIAKVSAHQKN